MRSRIDAIRENERIYHTEIYTNEKLYHTESWLRKPVKTVQEILPLFSDYPQLRVLDLGCGVGRNSICVAQEYRMIDCRVDCVDLLEIAIEKLRQNAREHGVASCINGVVGSIEQYEIAESAYDLIMAVSALEHVDGESAFFNKLLEIKKGVRDNGLVCFVVNSDVCEKNAQTHEMLEPQFEVNLSAEKVQACLDEAYSGWEVLKRSVVQQEYTIPRGAVMSHLSTKAVTYVARRNRPRERTAPHTMRSTAKKRM